MCLVILRLLYLVGKSIIYWGTSALTSFGALISKSYWEFGTKVQHFTLSVAMECKRSEHFLINHKHYKTTLFLYNRVKYKERQTQKEQNQLNLPHQKNSKTVSKITR